MHLILDCLLKCVDFTTNYFGLKDKKHDALSVSMQEAIIGMTQKKLQRELPDDFIKNIRNRGWSYMGLEMILDTVTTLGVEDLEEYLQNL